MASKVIAIIGARLGSSRLPGKQLLPLAGKPLIGRLVDRLCLIQEIDEIVVATTANQENKPLCDWAEGYGIEYLAWGGDENDLVGRVDAVVKKYSASTFVYVCGDCPMVEPATIRKLIQASVKIPTSGLVKLKPSRNAQPFIHEGFDVFNTGFWNGMMSVAHEPFEREHVGAVYHHLNKVEPSEIRYVDEDDVYAAFQHRLSVDTPDDYAFMSRVYDDWYAANIENSYVDLRWLIRRLIGEPNLVAINASVRQKLVHDMPLRVAILCEAGPQIGLGHLTRSCVAASAFKNQFSADVKLFIKAEPIQLSDLSFVNHEWMSSFDNVGDEFDVVVIDVKQIDAALKDRLSRFNSNALFVGVDIQAEDANSFDLVWMPSVHVPKKLIKATGNRLRYGLDCYLLRDPNHVKIESNMVKENSVIVLTGGADPIGLSQTLPCQLTQSLKGNVNVSWVRGPYADKPNIAQNIDQFTVLNAPESLHAVISKHRYALCVYGVTFYECLRAGVPTVVFDPIGAATDEEWLLLRDLFPELVACDAEDALIILNNLIANGGLIEMDDVAVQLAEGPNKFAETVKTFHSQKQELMYATA